MEPVSFKPIAIVLAIGLAVTAVGTGVLVMAFRAFGTKEAGRSSHIALFAALTAFIFLCCVALFFLSYAGH